MKGWRQPKDVSRVLCVLEENVKNVGFPAGKTITSLIGCPVVLCLVFSVFKSKGKFNLGRRYSCLSVSKVTRCILFFFSFFLFYAANLLKFELYPCLPLWCWEVKVCKILPSLVLKSGRQKRSFGKFCWKTISNSPI